MDINILRRYDTLDSNAVEYIRQTMMEYLRREFVDNTDSASEENCNYSYFNMYRPEQ